MAGDKAEKFTTTRRLLELIEDLDAGKSITIKGIRDRFGIKKNAAGDYVEFLQEVRCLESDMLGGQKRWTLATRDVSERTVVHIAALEFAVGALGWLEGTPYFEQLRALRRDVAAQVSVRDRDHVQRFAGAVRRRPFGEPSDAPAFSRAAKTLMHAIREHRPCSMRYSKLDGEVKEYRIEPVVLVLQQDRVFVMARKMPEALLRLFELEGIEEVTAVETETFVPPATTDDPTRLLDGSFGVYVDLSAPQPVRLRASGPALAALKRRRVHPSQAIGPLGSDGGAEVSFHVALSPPLRQFILGWMPHLRVIEPEGLKTQVHAAAVEFLDGDPSAGPRDPSAG